MTPGSYHPSADQLALAGTMRESLAALLPLSRLHTSFYEDAKTWSGLEEIGIFGMNIGEEQGGSGLGATEEALIVVGLGCCLASPGVLATIGAAHAPQDKAAVLRGERVAVGYRRGDRVIIVTEPEARLVLLRDQISAALFDSRTCASSAVESRLWLAELCQSDELSEPLARIEASGFTRLRLIDAAALAGIAESTLEMAVAQAGVREQFGRPIGSFQAVKHHCANMAIAARWARDQTAFAAVAVDQGRADAQLQVECAFLMAATAALENAGKNIQLHGGMGFSDEADPHLFVKRAQLLIAIAGGLEAATSRIANLKLDW